MPITEFDAAKKLQRMQPTQAIYAESMINQVLTKGLLGTLSQETNISDGFKPPLSTDCSSNISRPASSCSYTPGEVCHSWQTQYSHHTATAVADNNFQDTTAALFYENSSDFINNTK
ncbi:unnamed protein product [Acanthoscelides obtectus]|uniref:Uncharacterized protein n=1 Tax=Acanthoscelides obtectus TaxID=200917 RepID=A0A9P0PXZ0_ACAOB|nr:unnamed protein product [Acanthoscelides obtectus]CAK1680526.1 hypothetical protein AOBTE_LOCUS32727 [Acanthoscelides obtectus]